MIVLTAIQVAYGSRVALDDVSLTIERGEWLGLIGPNGAGKTTLLRALGGMRLDAGTIRLDGESLARLGGRRRARRIAVVEQQPSLPAGMRVRDFVTLGRTPYIAHFGREGHRDLAVVGEVLARLDLDDMAGRPLGDLSGGERQRAVVARALAQEPDVLLLDEPTSALDLGRQLQVLDLVQGLRAETGLTVVSATHDLSLAAAYSDRVALISRRRLAALGSPEEVITEAMLAEHYGVPLRVLRDESGAIAVVPLRAADAALKPRPAPAQMDRQRSEGWIHR